MNLLASGPEDLDFPGEETDSERSLAVMVEVGVMVLEWGSSGLLTQIQRAGMVSRPRGARGSPRHPSDVCSAGLGKADMLVPDGLSVGRKSWEGRREERC